MKTKLQEAFDKVAGQESRYHVTRDGVTIGIWRTKGQATAHINRMIAARAEGKEIGWVLK